MIPPELVRVRRRGERLELLGLSGRTRSEAERLADEIGLVLASSLGQSEEEIEQSLAGVERPASAEKLFAGLRKVALDGCEFEAPLEVDAVELRSAVFQRAAAERSDPDAGAFDRVAILRNVAAERALSLEALEQALFSDLRGARLLARAHSVSGEEILARYEQGQVQGVLLRAVRVTLDVTCTSSDAYRALFRKLKFRRLLHRIEPGPEGGYSIEIDGPLSLFESVTKYGLALAQLVPALRECQKVELAADLRWGRARDALTFAVSITGGRPTEPDAIRPEVLAVVDAVNRLGAGWAAELGSELLDVPGVGVVVPDLLLRDPAGRKVHVEVMGYWSREAVFRRVDWMAAQAGPGAAGSASPTRLLLAVSSQLRVSPDVVPRDAPGGIYVYKGAIIARSLLEQARALCETRT